MTSAAEPRKSIAVTLIGVLTLILGLAYVFLGCVFVYSGANMVGDLADDNAAHVLAPLLGLVAGFVIVVGVAFVVPGILGILAGTATLLRKPLGPGGTFIFAVFAILWGLAFLVLHDEGMTLIVLGAAQILYGVLAFVVLIANRAEFARSRSFP
jgi:hypothetical protein